MAWWERRASALQQAVRVSEDEISEPHSEDDAHRAAVHARQDLVLVVSHLSSLNRQIATIKLLLAALTAIAAYSIFRN